MSATSDTPSRVARLRRVLEDCIVRRRSGERLDDDAIISAHPDLLPDLALELRQLTAIDAPQTPKLPRESWNGDAGQADSATATTPRPPELARDAIPGYELREELHRGGQGLVYRAIQKSTGRDVAIKVMREGPFAGEAEHQRFTREVQVLAQLSHPNIVRIHDSGVAGGKFYYVMDFIDGEPLDRYVAARGWPIAQVLALFVKICDAVHAAHLRGVIHRDLKPSNVIINAAGEPQVLDFGLAKLSGDVTQRSEQTEERTVTGQFIGSLPWASPEQAEGRPESVDVRSDVYALGVILYQLLTGSFPYDVSAGMASALRNIVSAEPARPSAVRAQLNDELDTIVLKCLAKEPDRRYQSARDLAADIRRYLAGDPIEAKRDSTWYVFSKLMRRHRVAVTLAGLFLLAGFGFGVVMAFLYQQARTALREREANEALQQRAMMAAREELTRKRLYATRVALAQGRYEQGDLSDVSRLLDQCPAPLRGWEWLRLKWLSDRSLATIRGHMYNVTSVAVRADGKQIASTSYDRTIRTWDVQESGSAFPSQVFEGHDQPVLCVAYSPDGRLIASGSQDGTARIWVAEDAESRHVLRDHRSSVTGVCFSPDGRTLATCGHDQNIFLWNVETGARLLTLSAPGPAIEAIAFSPDGALLVTAGEDRQITIWDLATRTPRRTLSGHSGAVSAVVFCCDGKLLVSASQDQSVKVWDVESGRVVRTLIAHRGDVRAVAVREDGGRIVSGGDDGAVCVWGDASDSPLVTLRGHTSGVEAAAFFPDGRRIVTAGRDSSLKIWDADALPEWLQLSSHHSAVAAVQYMPDGKTLITAGQDLTLRLWEAGSGDELRTYRGHEWGVSAVAVGPEGRWFASASEDGSVRIWKPAESTIGRPLAVLNVPFLCLDYNERLNRVVAGDEAGRVRVWDPDTGVETMRFQGHESRVFAARFSPDGRMLATGGVDHTVRIWEVSTGRMLRALETHEHPVYAVCFLPDGDHLATASADRTVKIWQVHTGEETLTLRGHTEAVRAVICTPDGSRVLSAGDDGVVKIWDATTGEELMSLRRHNGPVLGLSVDPDGRSFASCGRDGQVIIWENEEPAHALRERRRLVSTARAHVNQLFSELHFADQVIARLEMDQSLDPALREHALGIARARGDNPKSLNDYAWSLVSQSGLPAETYLRALRMAEVACKLTPTVGSHLNTLGVAQYRVQDYAAALATLTASRDRNGDHPADIAFIAMSLQRLGRHSEAVEELERLRALTRKPEYAVDDRFLGFLRDADALILGRSAEEANESGNFE